MSNGMARVGLDKGPLHHRLSGELETHNAHVWQLRRSILMKWHNGLINMSSNKRWSKSVKG